MLFVDLSSAASELVGVDGDMFVSVAVASGAVADAAAGVVVVVVDAIAAASVVGVVGVACHVGVCVGVVVGDGASSDVVDAGVADCDAVIVDIDAVAGCCW